MSAVDLGCGTGEQTSTFAEKFSSSKFLRIDSSPEMLEQSKVFKKENSNFKISTTEAIIEDDKTSDLIFSNAALQWSDNHQKLFQKIISKLNKAGQLAMQMPYQSENKLNQILFDLAVEQAYKSQLNNWNRKSAVLSIDEYAKIFFEISRHYYRSVLLKDFYFTDRNISLLYILDLIKMKKMWKTTYQEVELLLDLKRCMAFKNISY
ncbi:class I SAM-dependent methyltransferase [Chryseobacterium sp. TY4]